MSESIIARAAEDRGAIERWERQDHARRALALEPPMKARPANVPGSYPDSRDLRSQARRVDERSTTASS
jgi:hypothetical protein